jgi:predicted NBD/HSP70 family sugar kinase
MQVGIDIGGTKMLLIAQSEGIVEHRHQCSTGATFSIERAESVIAEFIDTLPRSPTSIGIAIPGLVDESGRVIACDVLPQLEGWLLSSNYPLRVVNDAEAALCKTIDGLDPKSTTIMIMVGTGIGAGIYVNGQILRGAKGWAGELGSIPISGIMTLDKLASGAAILARSGGDMEGLIRSVKSSDEVTLQIIRDAGQALGLGMATVINIFNPDSIVLAGGTLAWDAYLEAALISAEESSLPDLWAVTKVQLSPYGGDLVALGAALMGYLAIYYGVSGYGVSGDLI